MRVWCLLVALVLALQGVGCAQVKKAGAKESLADRVALRIATAKLITDAFKQANRDLMTFGRFPEPLDEPMDLKAARILVQAYADAPSGTLDSAARLLDVANIESAQIAALVAKDAKYQGYLDQLLQFAAADVESRNKSVSDTSEQVEVRTNDSLTLEKAKMIVQTAEELPSLRSQETLAVLEQFRIGMVQAITRHPEYLKPFSEEKPPSQALQTSRTRVQKLLQSAKSAKE